MPVNKNKLLRLQTIDACLQRRNKVWTIEELQESCGRKLQEMSGKYGRPGKRTVEEDISQMKSGVFGYHAPIKFNRNKGGYVYTDPYFSINANPLKPEDIHLLDNAIPAVRSHLAKEVYEDYYEMVLRVKGRMHIDGDSTSIIQFDHAPRTSGIQWLEDIMVLIRNKMVMRLNYHPFDKDEHEATMHPYLLKEYNNRWYVIGYDEHFERVIFRALDRITSIREYRNLSYKPNVYFRPEDYFSHLIGITWYEGEKPEKVRFKATPEQARYLQTKPIHHTQQVIKETKKYLLFQIEVVLNYELEQALLRLGEKVRVIGPLRLVERMKKRVDEMQDNYKNIP